MLKYHLLFLWIQYFVTLYTQQKSEYFYFAYFPFKWHLIIQKV